MGDEDVHLVVSRGHNLICNLGERSVGGVGLVNVICGWVRDFCSVRKGSELEE